MGGAGAALPPQYALSPAGSMLYVDDETVESVISAPHGALILAKDDCGSCAVLYASGEKVDEFAASKGFFLMERAEDAGFISPLIHGQTARSHRAVFR
jgi:hypothetical protein